jgi:predicted nucleic acid-binding protein
MNAVVVDTDVVSLIFKGDNRADKHLSALATPDLLVSFMTEAELERWILQAKWGPERVIRFRTYMKRFVFCSVFPRFDRQMGGGNGSGTLYRSTH